MQVELRMLDAWYRLHRGEGVAMVGMAMDESTPIGRLREATGGLAVAIVPITRVRITCYELQKD